MTNVNTEKAPFISLHNHTELGSPLDGMNDTYDLFVRAKEVDHPAVAVTDHGTMTAIFDAWKASKKTGVQLIPGIEAYFAENLQEKKNNHLVLLAKNEAGYRNLLRLNYESYKNQSSGYMGKKTPRISWEHIEQYNEGVICLTACSNGLIAKTLITDQEEERAVEHISRLNSIFKNNFYLEIQPHSLYHINKNGKAVDQKTLNEALIRLSNDMDIPYVITCDAHYRDADHAKYHDFMLAVKDKAPVNDPDRFRYGVQDMYLKTHEEIISHFGHDIATSGMKTSIQILSECEVPYYLESKGAILPKFPVKNEKDYEEFSSWRDGKASHIDEDKALLRYRCIEGFKQIFADLEPVKKAEYWDRVKKELSVLESKDFSSYMLIVSDYTNWAKKNMPVGPARGSAAGSLVAYLTGITSINPMDYGLIFERFHNAEKTSFPDIDTDFAEPGKVKEYIKNKYGEDKVASISNVTTMSPKVAIKDAARSLMLGGDKGTAFKIANHLTSIMMDAETIEEAIELDRRTPDQEFTKTLQKYPELYEYASKLQGLTRNWSMHAAGVIISDRPLYEIVPLRIEQVDSNDPSTWITVTQWEKKRCEDFGLVKMDCLGLSTLNVIDDTLNIIEERTGTSIDMEKLPLDDSDTYDMIGNGQTSGVFQLESTMTAYCVRIKPRDIEGIAAINALGRPSCTPDVRQEYIDRVLGNEPVIFDHPKLERALEKTAGILLYEESAMYVAADVAGWNFNQADSLRKLSKLKGSDPAMALKTETDFIADSIKNGGLKYEEAAHIWKKFIEPMSGYSFNKSHSISYSKISYWTAWLRCHYPTEFMCALMNSENANSDKAQEYINECTRMGIRITPPDASRSRGLYVVTGDGIIATGLSAVKGVGETAIMEIINAAPKTLVEFFVKTSGRVVNKRVMEAMAMAGAFDCFDVSRKDIFDNYAKYRIKANNAISKVKDKKLDLLIARRGMEDFYKTLKAKDKKEFKESLEDEVKLTEEELRSISNSISFEHTAEEWDRKTFLLNEMESLGRTISGQIHEVFGTYFKLNSDSVMRLSDLPDLADKQKVKIEVIIKSMLKEFKIKNGKNVGRKFAKYLIEDIYGNSAEMTLWADEYDKYRTLLKDGFPMKAICQVNQYMGTNGLVLLILENVAGKRI